MGDLRRALDFIEAADASETYDELQRKLIATLADFGGNQFALMAVVASGDSGARTPMSLSAGTVREWSERYRERGYFNSDLIIHEAIRQSAPFTWEDLDERRFSPSAKTVFNEGRDLMKVNASLVVPMHDARGFAGLVSLFFADGPPPDSMHKPLRLIANFAMEKAKELRGVEAEAGDWDALCPLTPRQREALAFSALGKTDWEIGVILGITEKTANHHFASAKRHLGVATRAQAVAVAVHRGWVAL
jgi:LuxR family transcriptional regulator, quorum-sensing system regulator BjaR1